MSKYANPGSANIRMPWFVYWLKYKPRLRQLEKIQIEEGDVVFLGDSITEWNDWQAAFPEIRAHNFGIAGDTSFGVLSRLQQITSGAEPSQLFLLIGTNDMFTFRRVSLEELLSNIESIIKKINTVFPKTNIYVQSVMPRQAKFAEAIKELNQHIEIIAEQLNVTYIDLWGIMDDGSGRLRRDYTRDSLHLNKRGKRKWIDFIQAFVASSKQ
ncbi:MAG: GDSL-type esterase/lipase family protein [Gammaproteobacteria bacterium]|nr:GDSL-type esterase/lipase family protein [Gammaproteobacteria bacterium]